MRVLIVNKFYYTRGGDCVCAMGLERMLRENGHETAFFAMQYPKNEKGSYASYFAPEVVFGGGIFCKLKAMNRIFGGSGVKRAFANMLAAFRPDVVHFHNIHSYLSPAIVKMAKDYGAKTVWTMHDYKLTCPAYSCLSRGNVCESCIGGNKWPVVKKRCMKGSLAASLLAYFEAAYWNAKKLERYTDVFVCPSHFMASKMEQGGFERGKIAVVCNPVDAEKVRNVAVAKDKGGYYVYIGRLSVEKGVETLLEVAEKLPYKLKIAGGGPVEVLLKEKYKNCRQIEFLGHQNAQQVKMLLKDARFSVVPSEWYENNPLSIIESLCLGTPVVGARIGGIPELIAPENGFLFRSGDAASLSKTIETAWESNFDYPQIAAAAMEQFNEQRYLKEILAIYG